MELSSIAKRFWSLNDANAAAVRYVSRSCCVLETGRALLRWGLLALLLGAWMNGLPFFSRRVKMPGAVSGVNPPASPRSPSRRR